MKQAALFVLWLVLQVLWIGVMLVRWALMPLAALGGAVVYFVCGFGALISFLGTLIVAVVEHGPHPWAWIGPLLLTMGFLMCIVAYLGVCFLLDPSLTDWWIPRFYRRGAPAPAPRVIDYPADF